MEISINGKNIEYQIEQEKTIGEILGSVESECEKSGMTITGIQADGRVIPAENLDALFSQSIETVSKIELTTLSGNEVRSILHDLGSRFSLCVALLKEIPIQLQTGKDLAVLQTINSFSLDLQDLYQLLPLLSITGMPSEGPEIDGVQLVSYPSQLAPLLSELLAALEKKDTVLVGDLSEYELAPRIEKLGALLSAF